MESTPLSRSPSASFAPGPHRRSHPNLHHLSLAPLTPKYPIDPADYDAYFNPSTSELHTSTSISQVSGLPSPGGILTRSPALSRSSSKNRLKRRSKSRVSIETPSTIPSGALTSSDFGTKKSEVAIESDSSWLVQTGLALTEESRESKGQSWISKRDSSTSLQTAEERLHTGRNTSNRSRPSSRHRSRRDLKMTSTTEASTDYAAPDWADTMTQAEVAAQVESEFSYELDTDPYGLLDFEGHFDTEDEDDVRREMTRYRFGRWMDGVVDVFLRLNDEFPDPPHDPETATGSPVVPPLREVVAEPVDDTLIEPPPERSHSLWNDVTWFSRLVARTLRS